MTAIEPNDNCDRAAETHLWTRDTTIHRLENDNFMYRDKFRSFDVMLANWGSGTLHNDHLNVLMAWEWLDSDNNDLAEAEGIDSDVLRLLWFLPRKQRFVCVDTLVSKGDEATVRDFLAHHWRRMQRAWSPVSGIEPERRDYVELMIADIRGEE